MTAPDLRLFAVAQVKERKDLEGALKKTHSTKKSGPHEPTQVKCCCRDCLLQLGTQTSTLTKNSSFLVPQSATRTLV